MKRDFPDRPIVGVGAVIINGDRVLLVRRGGEPLAGEWSVPGGVVELGETLRAATEREAWEETGLRVRAGEVVDVFDSIWTAAENHGRPQYHYVLIDFLCEVISGELRAGSDAAEVRWVTRHDVSAMELRQTVRAVISKGFEKVATNR
jgi:ADP-ribose pyrophosphatase YjhB (NUDIX family)